MRSPRAAPPSPFNCGGAQCTAAPRLAATAFAISAVLPSAAPAGGGTAVVLHGVGLRDFGPLMRCAWNHTQFGVQHTEVSPDSTDGSGGARALRCSTPPLLVSGAARGVQPRRRSRRGGRHAQLGRRARADQSRPARAHTPHSTDRLHRLRRSTCPRHQPVSGADRGRHNRGGERRRVRRRARPRARGGVPLRRRFAPPRPYQSIARSRRR